MLNWSWDNPPKGSGAERRPDVRSEPVRVLSRWPLLRDLDSNELMVAYEYRYGSQQVQWLNGALGILTRNAQAAIAAADRAESGGNLAEIMDAADLLQSVQQDAEANVPVVVSDLLSEAARGFNDAASAFGEIGSEVAAWQGAMPSSVEAQVQEYAWQWRRVCTEASERYLAAERLYTDLSDVRKQLYARELSIRKLEREKFQTRIAQLEAEVARLREPLERLREAANTFLDTAREGVAIAEKAMRSIGRTLGSAASSFGLGAGLGVAILGGLALAVLALKRRR